MTREEEIRARLENIVPGGWARATPMVEGYPTEIWHAIDNTTICRMANNEDTEVNANFIYMAPEDIDYLLKENQRMAEAFEWIATLLEQREYADADMLDQIDHKVSQALEGDKA